METEYFIILAGDGESSRANTEALMEDYIYANGLGGTLVLAYDDKPSKSQVVAAMYAKEKGLDLLVFCNDDADTTGIPSASVVFTTHPQTEAIEAHDTWDAPESFDRDKAVVFVLGSDAGDTSRHMVVLASKVGLRVFDLCNGLIQVKVPTYEEVKDDFDQRLLREEATIREQELKAAFETGLSSGSATQPAYVVTVDNAVKVPGPLTLHIGPDATVLVNPKIAEAFLNLARLINEYGINI